MMSAVPASPSQYVLQYLLSVFALQWQLGCAHLSFDFSSAIIFTVSAVDPDV